MPKATKLKSISQQLLVSWDERLKELKQYKQLNGNCNVSTKDKDNKGLGKWVSHQRTAYKNGKLSPEQIEHLNDIGFEWELRKVVFVGWDEMFKQLKEYKQVNGHSNVSTNDEANLQLGIWVHNQRAAYKKGKLPYDRIKLLNGIRFEWELRKLVCVGWDERLKELKQYKQQNGNCNVSTKDKDNKQLGKWVSDQRTAYKMGKLSPDRIKLLEEIGFSWNPDEDKWDGMFGQLEEYKKKNGNCNVPIEYKANPSLANWVYTQRQLYKKGKLSPDSNSDRFNRLKEIGFVWNPHRGRRSAAREVSETENLASGEEGGANSPVDTQIMIPSLPPIT